LKIPNTLNAAYSRQKEKKRIKDMIPRQLVLIKKYNTSLLPKGLFCLQAVYMAGVVAASLGTSLSDPDTYIGNDINYDVL
jgi:hypothetical protein